MRSYETTNEFNGPPPGKLPFPPPFSTSATNDAFLRTIDWDDEGIRNAVFDSWNAIFAATRSDQAFVAGHYAESGYSRQEMVRRLERVIDVSGREGDDGAGGEEDVRVEEGQEEEIDFRDSEQRRQDAERLWEESEENSNRPGYSIQYLGPGGTSPLYGWARDATPGRSPSAARGGREGSSPISPLVLPAPAHLPPVLPPLPRAISPPDHRAPLPHIPHGVPFNLDPIAPQPPADMAPSAAPPTFRAIVRPAPLLLPHGLPSSSPPAAEPYSSGMGPIAGISEASPRTVDDSADEDERGNPRPRKRKRVTQEKWNEMGPLRRMEYEVVEVVDLTRAE